MSIEPEPATPGHPLGSIWRTEPVPVSRRPWLLATLTMVCVALVIAGSVGPWLYTEDGPARAVVVSTIHGVNTDGVFSLFFAVVAMIALLGAIARPSLSILGWVAVVALLLCSLVGLFDWVIFDPMALVARSTDRPTFVRVEWGLKLLTVAAPLGAASALLFTRRLMAGDY